jgi:hypothetical protein
VRALTCFLFLAIRLNFSLDLFLFLLILGPLAFLSFFIATPFHGKILAMISSKIRYLKLIFVLLCLTLYPSFSQEYDAKKECPDNSLCDSSFLKTYNLFIEGSKSLETKEIRYKFIKKFHQLHGLPILFYAKHIPQKKSNIAYWKDQCNKGDRKLHYYMKAMSFMKKLKEDKEKNFENVMINKSIFLLPLGARPLYIKNQKLVSYLNFENIVVLTHVDTKGDLLFLRDKEDIIKKAQEIYDWASCSPQNKAFARCYSVYDFDKQRVQTAKIEYDCLP